MFIPGQEAALNISVSLKVFGILPFIYQGFSKYMPSFFFSPSLSGMEHCSYFNNPAKEKECTEGTNIYWCLLYIKLLCWALHLYYFQLIFTATL